MAAFAAGTRAKRSAAAGGCECPPQGIWRGARSALGRPVSTAPCSRGCSVRETQALVKIPGERRVPHCSVGPLASEQRQSSPQHTPTRPEADMCASLVSFSRGRKVPQSACKPNPVPSAAEAALGDDHSSSPAITRGVQRPTRWLRADRPDNATLFGLAPRGVWPATRVAASAVRSYRTISPLPRCPGAVYFLCHFPSSYPARALPGALPFGVRTFLPVRHFSA